MNDRECALVAAYEAARPLTQHSDPDPRWSAGLLVKAHGSAKAALARWERTGARLPYPTDKAKAWADGVARALREAMGEGSN